MKKHTLVRYIPNFCGSPAWMSESDAQRHFTADSALVESLIEAGAATTSNLPEIHYPAAVKR